VQTIPHSNHFGTPLQIAIELSSILWIVHSFWASVNSKNRTHRQALVNVLASANRIKHHQVLPALKDIAQFPPTVSYAMTPAQLLGNGSSSLTTAQTSLELVPQNARSMKVLHNTSSCCYPPCTLTAVVSPVMGSLSVGRWIHNEEGLCFFGRWHFGWRNFVRGSLPARKTQRIL